MVLFVLLETDIRSKHPQVYYSGLVYTQKNRKRMTMNYQDEMTEQEKMKGRLAGIFAASGIVILLVSLMTIAMALSGINTTLSIMAQDIKSLRGINHTHSS